MRGYAPSFGLHRVFLEATMWATLGGLLWGNITGGEVEWFLRRLGLGKVALDMCW